jgi:hypothetical protein
MHKEALPVPGRQGVRGSNPRCSTRNLNWEMALEHAERQVLGVWTTVCGAWTTNCDHLPDDHLLDRGKVHRRWPPCEMITQMGLRQSVPEAGGRRFGGLSYFA